MRASIGTPFWRGILAFAGTTVAIAADWPMLGGRPERNMVSGETGLPTEWSAPGKAPGRNFKWSAELGDVTYGAPVVADGRVFIGGNHHDATGDEKRGVLRCFSAADGRLLWKAEHAKLEDAGEDDRSIGICSTPHVVDGRVYYVSNRAELVCREARDGALVWSLDLRATLKVSPNQASASSPLVVDGRVFVVTGQGANYKTGKVANPAAPSFAAVEAASGRVLWTDSSPGAKILTGQWGSPAHGVVDGKPQVLFPGGDGWLYAFDPATGKLRWKFNCKAHEKPAADGEPETTFNLVAAPVLVGHRVLVAVGEPEASSGPGALRCIDARGSGDITATGELWRLGGADFNDSMSTVAVHEGLVFATDTPGFVNCIDLATGRRHWVHDLKSGIWGSPLVADGRVYVQTADGDVFLFSATAEKRLLGKVPSLPDSAHGTPVVAQGVLYLTGQRHLFALALAR
ncbi:MAG: PQQ-binding-like beta-propeller repeat protein [Verrucomicrobia bacterium]|nr:PQQ-binding-like beta-propeller repeat protein [Verrucomicrobiota bacterium]